jgi:hypothetical protein
LNHSPNVITSLSLVVTGTRSGCRMRSIWKRSSSCAATFVLMCFGAQPLILSRVPSGLRTISR